MNAGLELFRPAGSLMWKIDVPGHEELAMGAIASEASGCSMMTS